MNGQPKLLDSGFETNMTIVHDISPAARHSRWPSRQQLVARRIPRSLLLDDSSARRSNS
jgi:hypothetical protein